MMMEALAAGVIGLALLWLVAQPMLFPSALIAEPFEPPDPEETPRGQALLALKEIEFDRATGKLSETDFNQLHSKYAAAAIAVLEPGDDPVEALIAHRAQAVQGGSTAAGSSGPNPRCLTHGVIGEPGARFCPKCGAGLLAAAGTCLSCGVAVPSDGMFCPGCGVRVRSA